MVADCVNPVKVSRAGWRAVAERTAFRLVEVEVICSDLDEHRRRVTMRRADIPGHVQPTWQQVSTCIYEPWDRPRVVIDSATSSPAAAADAVVRARASRPLVVHRPADSLPFSVQGFASVDGEGLSTPNEPLWCCRGTNRRSHSRPHAL